MASKAAHLRVTAPDEAPPRPLTLAEAAASGDYRALLVAQRDEIAASIPDERGPAKAALHRQLSLIAKELANMDETARGEAGQDGLTGEIGWDAAAI